MVALCLDNYILQESVIIIMIDFWLIFEWVCLKVGSTQFHRIIIGWFSWLTKPICGYPPSSDKLKHFGCPSRRKTCSRQLLELWYSNMARWRIHQNKWQHGNVNGKTMGSFPQWSRFNYQNQHDFQSLGDATLHWNRKGVSSGVELQDSEILQFPLPSWSRG